MKKFLLVIFLISVLTSGLFAVESNIDTSGLEEISWEEVGDIIEFEGKYYIFFE
jgi:hypothetical protein